MPSGSRRRPPAVGARYKLIKSADGQRELYDLIADPGEQHNLIDELPDEAQRLSAYVRDWLEKTPAYASPASGERLVSPEALEALRSLGYAGDGD